MSPLTFVRPPGVPTDMQMWTIPGDATRLPTQFQGRLHGVVRYKNREYWLFIHEDMSFVLATKHAFTGWGTKYFWTCSRHEGRESLFQEELTPPGLWAAFGFVNRI